LQSRKTTARILQFVHACESQAFCLFPRVAGAPGKLDYLYLTEPGEFTLTPRLRLTADGQPLTLQGKAVRINVQTSETR
jgi:hypothetical protein